MNYQEIIETYLNGNLTAAAEALEAGGAALTARTLVSALADGWFGHDDAFVLVRLLEQRKAQG